MKQSLFSLLLLLMPLVITGQNYLEMPVTMQLQDVQVAKALTELEGQLGFNFSYEAQLIDANRRVSIHANKSPLKKVLKTTLGNSYDFKVVGTHVIIQSTLTPLDKRADKFSFAGQVVGPDNHPLENAIVYEANRQQATFTSTDGYYQLNFRDKDHPAALSISHIGFRDTVIYVSKGQMQQVRIIPLPGQRILPSNFSEMETRSATMLSQHQLTGISDIGLAKFMVNDEALFVSNNLNVFNWQRAQISLLPYVGTNDLMNGLTTNNASFNVIAGYTAQIEGVEFGAVSNFIQNSVYGFQGAGVSNVVGKHVGGFQAAGITNVVVGNMEGGQASGVINRVKGHHSGVMAAGVINITEGNEYYPTPKGFNAQVSGLTNIHLKDTSNLQISSVWNQAEHINGIQISALANYTKKLNGVQIGIVNIADTVETGVPIGLINIVKHGYHAIEFSTNELFRYNVAFKTGGNHLYSFLNAGIDNYIGAGYGFGYTTNYNRKASLNIDVYGAALLDPHAEVNSYMGTLYRAQLGINYHLFKHFTISTGPAFNFFALFQDTGSEPPAELNKPSGMYYGGYFLEKAISTQSNQHWIGWHMSVRF
ncbi:STN domain-containing protein [Carboxylicivirga mesophila]|uniref:STN domain-containing protein n=1 Tax=Carboxylicivirga mesophila TaxID=1166478 RepID=A0ABS5KBT0_9BACT|nr:STN and carboxypeptidase regulatory-like domain-containing protein [Carboxylicivirga mesophila]MBS2212499.1 STN domain-containing protein [Carboxylicivirga mesophila]